MDVEKYIASGILELYVAGTLSEKENLEIANYAKVYPEIKKEIEEIEASILELSRKASPGYHYSFKALMNRINGEVKVVDMNEKRSTPFLSYMGWAASILLAVGLFWMYQQNQELKSNIEVVEKQNVDLEQQIADTDSSLEQTQELLNTLRDKNISVIPLGGQDVSPTSYAKAYWNKQEEKVFIDAKGLPEPPDGFVYQVWSLKLSPLTPTSMGLLEDFATDENKVFALNNPNDSEAFGITLEPAGGSESPTLEQLYTLGVVNAS
ncbi:MAG TPA: anti-sigma factor [Maribacter sp.]|uniref:anti-sigma factor n=1 Tax=unclassified Maribacter TaxID=2615042 RepID=UPI000ED96BE1|nr:MULTISPECIES: anti-sigma factor [unclassified Maribacter]HAF76983.1 anti-sigma factor [Maribacter sp.]|tara:strand:+ start:320643 stop:321437 length:795 start_codon:yes stop_codon:yes gene_type:complete